MIEENTEVNRTDLTASSFSVLVKIYGYTNIKLLSVRCIAIDINFPHHLNCFDNVPINYGSAALVNVTTPSTSITYYSNIINYTLQAQASGFTYTQFSNPLQNNVIILFMSSISITSLADSSSWGLRIQINVNSSVLSQTTYQIQVSFGIKTKLLKLHFSQIIFDRNDIDSSMAYQVVYFAHSFTNLGGSVAIQP